MNKERGLINQTYKNILNGSFAIFLVAASSLILTPVILNNLGKELYGLWLIVFNFLAYFYLIDFGITNAIVRLFAKYKATRKRDLYKLISTSYILITFLSALLIFLLIELREPIFTFLEIRDELINVFNFIYFVGVLEISSHLILRVNIGVLKGKHRYDLAYNLEGLAAISRLIVVLLLSVAGFFNIFNFTLAYACIKIFCDGISFYLLRNEIRSIRLIFDLDIFKELSNIGSSSLLISVLNFLIYSVPILLFGKYFGLINVVLYSIPFAVMRLVTRVINTIYNGINPAASELKALGDIKQIQKISSFGVKLASLISLPALGFCIIFSKEVLFLWLGNSELNSSDLNVMSNILVMLFVFLIFENILKINTFIYKSTGYHWYVTLETLLSSVLLYLVSYFLIDSLNFYIFSFALILVGAFRYFYYKFISLFIMRTFSMPIINFLIILFYCSLLFLIDPYIQNIFLKFIIFACWLMLYVSLSYMFLFNKNERHTILNQFNSIFVRFIGKTEK